MKDTLPIRGRVQPNKMICKWCNIHYENYLFILLCDVEGISWLARLFYIFSFIKSRGPVDPKVPVIKGERIYTYIHSYQLITHSNPTLFTPLATYESVFMNLLIKKADYSLSSAGRKEIISGIETENLDSAVLSHLGRYNSCLLWLSYFRL